LQTLQKSLNGWLNHKVVSDNYWINSLNLTAALISQIVHCR
jgi:hypothetical protein